MSIKFPPMNGLKTLYRLNADEPYAQAAAAGK
jgi:hypothetical protein